MPTKISEKNLMLSIMLFSTAIVLLSGVKLFNAPVEMSEKGIALAVVGILLFSFSIRLLKKAIQRKQL